VLAVYAASKAAVDECRAGRGPVLIEVKTMRMKGHAQHDPAEYVPKAMMEFWKQQDPIARYEKYLTDNKLWDAAKKSEIDARIDSELDADQKFAEESPLPPPELAEQGVYCEGCHNIQAQWQRAKAEVMPPKSSEAAAWKVTDFGAFMPAAAPVLMPTPKPVAPAATAAPAPSAPLAEVETAEADPDGGPPQEVKLRVPFGRGPKDRSVELERRDKAAEQQAQRLQQPQPRHRGGKPHKKRRR
jgi:hypothetical protein